MIGKPTKVSAKIEDYAAGTLTLDELTEWIAGHRFNDPPRDTGSLAARDFNNEWSLLQAGSFGEVYSARDRGLITDGDLDAILRRIHDGERKSRSMADLFLKDFAEDDHPRDDHGRFTSGGGSGGGKGDAGTPDGSLVEIPHAPPISNPMTKEEADARGEHVEKAVDLYIDTRGDTQKQFDQIDGKMGVYSPERMALHERILSDFMAKYEGVPNDRQAVMLGGMGGAGKTTMLKTEESSIVGVTLDGDNITSHAVVNPDDFKEALAAAGATPELPGLSPLETAAIVHEESSDIAKEAMERLLATGKNVVVDGTLSSAGSALKKLDQFQANGYEARLAFVSVTVDRSVDRAMGRWERGVNEWNTNALRESAALGGRYVPEHIIRESADPTGEYRSKNEHAFEDVRQHPAVVASIKFDSMGDKMKVVDQRT